MVLENLFPESWLEKKARYAFLLAVLFSTISIVVSRLLFGSNSGIVSVFITSLLYMHYLKRLLRREEELKDKKDTYMRELLQDNILTFKIYLFAFLGIYLTYSTFSFLMPMFNLDPLPFFREQLSLVGVKGQAATLGSGSITEYFITIVTYNWWVIFACFMLALLIGDGAIFFVAWNASSWGAILGYRSITAAMASGASPISTWFFVSLITLPHLVLEGTAYILSAISGGVISEEVIHKTKDVRRFVWMLTIGILALCTVYYVLSRTLSVSNSLVFTILSAALLLALLSFTGTIFKDKSHKEVFQYHFWLFIVAIGILIIAALVEGIVLSSSDKLLQIYALAG